MTDLNKKKSFVTREKNPDIYGSLWTKISYLL